MKITICALTLMLLTACAGSSMPDGAVAGCGNFQYTGTWTKSQTNMRALWLSDDDIAASLSVEDAIALANAMGCNT